MSLRFPLQETRTFRFSLHTSRLSLPWEVTIQWHCGAEICNGFTLCVAKKFFAIFVPTLSTTVARAARRVIENSRQTIKSCPVLLLCVRYIRWEREREREREIQRERERERYRERERERERERDGSDVTIVALKLAMNSHVPFAKNSHNWRWVYTFPCQKLALFFSPFTLPVSPFTER